MDGYVTLEVITTRKHTWSTFSYKN